MIGLSLALDTEILTTRVAPNSIISHVLGSLSRDRLPLLILLLHIDLSWRHFHDVSALTLDKIW